MIKAIVTIGPQHLETLVIGLSMENVERLVQGKPIRFRGSEIGLTEVDQVVVHYGVNNADIVADLASIGVILDKEQ